MLQPRLSSQIDCALAYRHARSGGTQTTIFRSAVFLVLWLDTLNDLTARPMTSTLSTEHFKEVSS